MILILRGSVEAVRAECCRRFELNSHGLWIAEAIENRRYWSAFRQLLPQIRQICGDEIVESALARYRATASLILSELRPTLDIREKQELEAMKAKITSHLTHNWSLDRPVMHSIAALLSDLMGMEAKKFTVFVPDLSQSHAQTLALLVILHRRFPATAPDLIIGYDPAIETHYIDAHGLSWGNTAERQESLLRAIMALGGTVEDATEEIPESLGEPELVLDRWDANLDGRAFALLAQASGPLSPAEATLVFEAAQRAFEAFGREVAVALCLGLLDTQTPLDRQQQATVHGLAGLSAHNWQFETAAGNPLLTNFLEKQFGKALELETDPVTRVAHLYRLAVTIGRRRKDFLEAKRYADQAVLQARSAEVRQDDGIYHEIWGRNIRAYLHMRLHDLNQAFIDSEKGLELAEELLKLRDDRDARFTRTTVADNNLTLCKILGDETRLFRRVRENMGFLDADPESFGGRFSAGAWVQLFREKHRLDLAIQCAQYGLEDAGNDYIHFRWYYLSQLADLHYRCGHADEAVKYFEKTLEVRKFLQPVQNMVLLGLPVAKIRAGQLTEAEAQLRSALTHRDGESPPLRVEVLGVLAIVYARMGKPEQSEECLNEAIEIAVGLGIRDLLLGVARDAAAAAKALGRRDQAEEAYRRGLEISQTLSESPPPPDLLAALLTGLVELDAATPLELRKALRLLPEGLLQDSELWWGLPCFMSRLSHLLEQGFELEQEGEQRALASVLTASSQRPDCSAVGIKLNQLVPEEVFSHTLVL